MKSQYKHILDFKVVVIFLMLEGRLFDISKELKRMTLDMKKNQAQPRPPQICKVESFATIANG